MHRFFEPIAVLTIFCFIITVVHGSILLVYEKLTLVNNIFTCDKCSGNFVEKYQVLRCICSNYRIKL